ncbi:non-ribosomal peptide synthetase [Paenarthrobacter sp. Z7-10]|uniref:non-ribosomal peptide synthetase n=1 Tax=Paenarthrobacter sp. Z7-10 TaxID=2787635 RepID=UPI0022A98A5D|nr:amino acid adenylation domain-containing protein [Paenarthrobacter sp. Z7-10]
MRLTGDLKPDALAAAIDDLVHRHEVLRTIYPATDGTPEQHILNASDVTGILQTPAASSAQELAALVSAGAKQGFDVRTDLPLRAMLIRVDADEWVLHLVMHHIATDGASLAPLARDISTAYSARTGGARALQRPLALQYADFTLWQREMLAVDNPAAGQARVLDTKLEAWRQVLAGLPAELALPADAPRPDDARQQGGQHSFSIPGASAKALASLAGEHNASLFMALHATLAGFLKRIGAGEDVVIGSPTAGRNDPALADLIGFFVNTVPIRLDASNNPSFRELLLRARASVLDAFDKDDVPFERLVSALNPPRKLGRHPVFQTMLTVENTPRAAVELQGVQAMVEPETSTGEAKFDLSFTFRELGGDDGLAATLHYNASMFSPDTVRELVQRLETFIELAVAAPDHPVSRLDILPESELAQLVGATDGTATEAAAPAPETILDAFTHTVAQQSDDTAVVFGPESLTFAQLDADSDRIARRLLVEGVTADDLVSVYLPRSLATITAVFGVLKSGAAYNPIDVDYPAERVSAILTDAAPKVVLTSRAVAAGLDGPLTETGIDSPHVVCLEDLPAAGSGAAGAGTILPRHLAYAMFTSGSTGRPKGVEISHGALANLLASHRTTVLPQAAEGPSHGRTRVAHTTGVGFDASWDPMLWMVDGHELHLIDDELRRNPQGLAGYFAEHNIGAWETTPSYLRQLMREPVFAEILKGREAAGEAAATRTGTPAGTQAPLHLAIGGEAFDAELWQDLASRSSVRAWNLYGPTEATVDSLVAEVGASEVPVLGTPVRSARAYVLDEHLQHVPAGASGELYLAGRGLARGYRGRPDLTAERFAADPFSRSGERMYRTGDIVTRHRDGAIVFRGRNDDQVKIRGFRVELGEIESALRSVPGVREAAVLVVDGTGGTNGTDGAPGADPARLVGYLVAEEAAGADAPRTAGDPDDGDNSAAGAEARTAVQKALEQRVIDAARTQLRSVLPGYMVPSALMAIPQMPLTAHGKLDIRALPAAAPSKGGDGRPPRTPKEKAVAQIFADVLSLPVVGVDESFFDLGGHSFLAQPLISRINDALGTDLPVQSLFRAPTVEQLVAEASKGAGESVAASLERVLPLRSTGSKAPLFAVHPASGVSWGYAAMLRRLDKERPLIGLQMPGMSAEADAGIEAATLTEFVDDYISQLKSVQPQGPYHLLGWSFGGNLVQRLATRLQECGDEVAFLAILDAYPTNQESNSDIGTGPALLASYLQAVGYPAPAAEERILDAARVLEILRENHNPLGNIPLASVQAMVDNFSVLARLIRTAELTEFDGDLYFFSATEQVPQGRPAADAWQPYVSGRIIDTPVAERHSQMLSERALDDISPVLAIQLSVGTE